MCSDILDAFDTSIWRLKYLRMVLLDLGLFFQRRTRRAFLRLQLLGDEVGMLRTRSRMPKNADKTNFSLAFSLYTQKVWSEASTTGTCITAARDVAKTGLTCVYIFST
jgi:predicted branched-subunit amino acid permease